MTNNKEIDILFVSHAHQLIGGAEKALLNQLIYLNNIGVICHVIVAADDTFTNQLRKFKIGYSIISLPWWVRGPGDNTPYQYSLPDPKANVTSHIIELIRKLKPKLCVTNTIVMPWLAYAASITKTRHVWLIHEMGTVGLGLSYDIGEYQTFLTIDMFSDAIFYNSKITAEYCKSFISPVKTAGIIYPGTGVSKPENITSPYHTSSFKIINVGHIKPQKAQLDSVKAVHNLILSGIDTELILVGDFEDKLYVEKIKNYINNNSLERVVHLVGHQKNPSSYVNLADVAVVCATNEAFGMVTVEAMMLGKPVVGAKSGGTMEIINHYETGLLYEPNNIDDLVSKLKLLHNDPKLAQRLAEKAYIESGVKYSPDARYLPFVDYFNNLSKLPQQALSLSPLASVFNDYFRSLDELQDITNELNKSSKNLSDICNSRSWRLIKFLRKLILK